MKRGVAALAAVLMLVAACTGEGDSHQACSEALDRQQNEVGVRAVADTQTAASTIEGVLERQTRGRLDPDQKRLLRGTQGRLRTLSRDLDEAFNTGCM